MTTSTYAVLGLLALQPWSAYDLAQQAERSLRFAWPKSERHLYTEPKKLVTLGYATVHDQPAGPTRTRKIYEITDGGREALRVWTATPPSAPAFEAEAMVRLLFAEHGTVADLTASFAKLKVDTEDLHNWSLDIVRGYLSGDDVPFPERLHLAVLLATFQLELFTLIEAWTDFAAGEIAHWDTTDDPGPLDRTDLITQILARGESVLDHPELNKPR